jgi:hypothetical protein
VASAPPGPTSSPMLTLPAAGLAAALPSLDVAVSDAAWPALCCALGERPRQRRMLPLLLPWEWPGAAGRPAEVEAAPLLVRLWKAARRDSSPMASWSRLALEGSCCCCCCCCCCCSALGAPSMRGLTAEQAAGR